MFYNHDTWSSGAPYSDTNYEFNLIDLLSTNTLAYFCMDEFVL